MPPLLTNHMHEELALLTPILLVQFIVFCYICGIKLTLLILQEYCGLFRICAGASLMSGVVLIAKPPILFANMVPDDYEYDVVGKCLCIFFGLC